MADLPQNVDLAAALRSDGYVFVVADAMRGLLGAHGTLDERSGDTTDLDNTVRGNAPRGVDDWDAFAASWNDLRLDDYMADGGRYRRRRYARYVADPGGVRRRPHGPHFQSLEYNPVNGGIERWFQPIEDAIGASRSLVTILEWSHRLFGSLAPGRAWDIEVHQFRIEARAGETASPTPEGPHRDGVDYVLVLLVQRRNIASGTTTVHAADGAQLGSFTLAAPFDATLIDDARVHHGVTPVTAIDPNHEAFRDVLVVTFRVPPAA